MTDTKQIRTIQFTAHGTTGKVALYVNGCLAIDRFGKWMGPVPMPKGLLKVGDVSFAEKVRTMLSSMYPRLILKTGDVYQAEWENTELVRLDNALAALKVLEHEV